MGLAILLTQAGCDPGLPLWKWQAGQQGTPTEVFLNRTKQISPDSIPSLAYACQWLGHAYLQEALHSCASIQTVDTVAHVVKLTGG
jgi:hypothetical protein